MLGGVLLCMVVFVLLSAFDLALAQNAEPTKDIYVTRWAFIAAAIATGLSAIAGGIAVAYVGAAAVGAVSEKPEVAGRTLIFVGLAEGIAIYGLIIAIMILGKV
jgi:V/A-type H+-transporting ATPase subunit K